MVVAFVPASPAVRHTRTAVLVPHTSPACRAQRQLQQATAASPSSSSQAEATQRGTRAFFGTPVCAAGHRRRFLAPAAHAGSSAALVRCSAAPEALAAALQSLPVELAASGLTGAVHGALSPLIIAGAGAVIVYLGKQIAEEALKKSSAAKSSNDSFKLVQIVLILALALVLLKMV